LSRRDNLRVARYTSVPVATVNAMLKSLDRLIAPLVVPAELAAQPLVAQVGFAAAGEQVVRSIALPSVVPQGIERNLSPAAWPSGDHPGGDPPPTLAVVADAVFSLVLLLGCATIGLVTPGRPTRPAVGAAHTTVVR
jgi:hypothetical protein